MINLENLKPYRKLTIMVITAVVGLSTVLFFARRVDGAKIQFQLTRQLIDEYRSVVWQLGTINQRSLDRDFSALKKRFSARENISFLIGELTDLAHRHDLEVNSIKPQTGQIEGKADSGVLSVLDRFPIEASVEGEYENLALFLNNLSRLDNGVLEVMQFSLRLTEGHSKRLDLSFTVRAYTRNSSGEDIFQKGLSQWTERKMLTYKSRFDAVGRNPFIRVERLRDQAFVIEGILFDENAPVVLMNGEFKSVGDVINGATILEIQQSAVVIGKGKEKIRVRLNQS
jgi:Tfp pilus assembly protein PilO